MKTLLVKHENRTDARGQGYPAGPPKSGRFRVGTHLVLNLPRKRVGSTDESAQKNDADNSRRDCLRVLVQAGQGRGDNGGSSSVRQEVLGLLLSVLRGENREVAEEKAKTLSLRGSEKRTEAWGAERGPFPSARSRASR